jgi:probable phosphomutase (TIGR03848 family)
MTTIVLLRHAHSMANQENLLAGRTPGVTLSKTGQGQAAKLIERIGATKIDHIYISPMERCQLTIAPWLSSRFSKSLLSYEIDERLNEVDYGKWSNRKLSSLRRDPLWKTIQSNPSRVQFPGGEKMKTSQKRGVDIVQELLDARGDKINLLVAHSDLIKMIATHFLGSHLDTFQRIDISPASFTVISGKGADYTIRAINSQGSLSDYLGKR